MASTTVHNSGVHAFKTPYSPDLGKADSAPVKQHPQQAAIDLQIGKLQTLWDQYQNNGQCPKIRGQILTECATLRDSIGQNPLTHSHSESLQIAYDYLLACTLTMEEPATPIAAKHIESKARFNDREFITQAAEDTFNFIATPLDGSCCIHAALGCKNPETAPIIRGDVVAKLVTEMKEEVTNNWDQVITGKSDLVPSLTNVNLSSPDAAKHSIDEYGQRMAQPHAYFGARELRFLAEILGITIIVLDPEKTQLDEEGKLTTSDLLTFGNGSKEKYVWHDGLHYTALELKPGAKAPKPYETEKA